MRDPEKHRQRQKKFRCSEKGIAYEKNYKILNAEHIKIHHKRYDLTPKAKFNKYKQNAKRKNLNFALTFEDFLTYWGKPCHYCKMAIKTIGLDRINNIEGYILHNIVSCCSVCNKMKSNLSLEEFISKCRTISKNFAE